MAESHLRYVRAKNEKFGNALEVISNELVTYSIRQFTNLYRKPGCMPLFAMPRGINEVTIEHEDRTEESFPYYLTMDVSLDIMSKLLDFQTQNRTSAFLKVLVDILDKRVPKLNTMFVYGPPCSGKNYFFDMVINFFLIRGQLMNINKNSNFPYMDCVDRRVILFNEPNICESPSILTL